MAKFFLGLLAGAAIVLAAVRRRELVQFAPSMPPMPSMPSMPGRGEALEELTKDELYSRAQKADIPGRSEMTKDQLIRALRKA
ncbi:MAG: hypothetical protein QOE36_258 [Gaiellaceae bacterium]|jgi:hypothetical protein|nr:hypothetical protein [Gaiellaceae bacterium]